MGFFDEVSKLATGSNVLGSLGSAASGIGSELHSVTSLAYPQELRNLVDDQGRIEQRLNEFDSAGVNNPQAVTMLRISMMDSYLALRAGGSPVPTNPMVIAAIKAHPAFLAARGKYAQLEVRMQAAEKKFNGCTFGFQMADGSISPLDLGWTNEQWNQLQAQAKDNAARCWLDTDRNSYL